MSAMEKFSEWVAENRANQPSLGAEMAAMTREAVKDVRGAIHESYFGTPEHAPEMGTPLNPTPKMVTDDLMGKEQEQPKSMEDLMAMPPQQDMGQERGMDGREM